MIKYFEGGWNQKDSIVNETKVWKNNILFVKESNYD